MWIIGTVERAVPHKKIKAKEIIMETYYINLENTGLDTDEQVQSMAELMRADGHDVEFTRNFGLINPNSECPVSDGEWFNYLERA